MNKSLKQLDAQALSGKLAAQGFIHPHSFSFFNKTTQLSLFQTFSSLVQSIESRTKNNGTIAVFQTIPLRDELIDIKKCLQTPGVKKVGLLNELTKLLIPDKNKRDLMNKIRLKVLQQIKEGQTPQKNDIELLGQLYSLLTFKSKTFYWENIGQLKKLLTSLKKMMGNDENLEEDEKKSKKKAYQQNLVIRKFVLYCFESIQQETPKKKAELLLKSPKNKKWFGVRLYKLLQEQNWTNEEMLMLANEINKVKRLEKIKDIRLRPIRSKIGKMESNIRRYLKERSGRIEETSEGSFQKDIMVEQNEKRMELEESIIIYEEDCFMNWEESISDYLLSI